MTEIKALLLATMDVDVASFRTPPNPGHNRYQTPNQKNAQSTLDSLLKLHELGIISKAELRAKVLAWNPNPSPPSPSGTVSPSVTVSVNSPPSHTTLPVKRCREYIVIDQQDENQQRGNKKCRPGKPMSQVAELRKIVRDPTRRRFFEQCCDPQSILWTSTPAGKECMHKLLFVAASQDPLNLVYQTHPGQTHNVKHSEVMNVMKWQVVKDRSNWVGKTPKRALSFGSPMPFNWETELAKIQHSEMPIQRSQSLPIKLSQQQSPSSKFKLSQQQSTSSKFKLSQQQQSTSSKLSQQ